MKRILGRSGIEVSAMGMGCWAIGGPFWHGTKPLGWGQVDDEESIRAIHAAIDMGVNFFDTANQYGAGHSEKVLGRAFAGRRDKVVIATKFFYICDEVTKQATGCDASPEGIRQQCTDSLRRLNTDYIDLLQFHESSYPADEAGPVRDTLEALVSEGKIRAYGWSTDFPDRALSFVGGPNCTSFQFQHSVFEDNPAMRSVCEEHEMAAINRGPLASGILTKKYTPETTVAKDDYRSVKAEMRYFADGKPKTEWLAKRDAVAAILTSGGRTVGQGALAWLWARSPRNIPIPGFRTVKQVQENAGAMAFGPLTRIQMGEIEAILDPSSQHYSPKVASASLGRQ